MDEVSFYENFSVPNPHLRSALLREIADGRRLRELGETERNGKTIFIPTLERTLERTHAPRGSFAILFFLYAILPLARVRPRFVR